MVMLETMQKNLRISVEVLCRFEDDSRGQALEEMVKSPSHL